LVVLADEKGGLFWKAFGMLTRGMLAALNGKALEASQMLTSGLAAYKFTGATLFIPMYLSYLATAFVDLGKLDDARRCIREALTAIETTEERWFEAEVNR